MIQYFTAETNTDVNKVKIIAPKIDPCGIPQETLHDSNLHNLQSIRGMTLKPRQHMMLQMFWYNPEAQPNTRDRDPQLSGYCQLDSAVLSHSRTPEAS